MSEIIEIVSKFEFYETIHVCFIPSGSYDTKQPLSRQFQKMNRSEKTRKEDGG